MTEPKIEDEGKNPYAPRSFEALQTEDAEIAQVWAMLAVAWELRHLRLAFEPISKAAMIAIEEEADPHVVIIGMPREDEDG